MMKRLPMRFQGIFRSGPRYLKKRKMKIRLPLSSNLTIKRHLRNAFFLSVNAILRLGKGTFFPCIISSTWLIQASGWSQGHWDSPVGGRPDEPDPGKYWRRDRPEHLLLDSMQMAWSPCFFLWNFKKIVMKPTLLSIAVTSAIISTSTFAQSNKYRLTIHVWSRWFSSGRRAQDKSALVWQPLMKRSSNTVALTILKMFLNLAPCKYLQSGASRGQFSDPGIGKQSNLPLALNPL